MKTRYVIFIFAAAFIAQSTVLRYVAVNGVSPNLVLCLVIVFAFLYDEPYGIALGAVFGVLLDLNFGMYVGVSGISFMCAAVAMGQLKKYLNHELALPAMVGGLMGSILNNTVYWGIYKIAGVPHSLAYILKMQPTSIVYNVVLVIALHLILRRGVIRHRKDLYYKGSFREARGLKL
ncbi:MAG: rod shape-determining protein MreD [Clostridiales Family XIII bacterium]|nr:rod shape-determining protein MreD [Clostridiales Family XIII bacterium]